MNGYGSYSEPISNLLRKSSMRPANFNREFACKQSIHVEMWQVLNRYHICNKRMPFGIRLANSLDWFSELRICIRCKGKSH